MPFTHGHALLIGIGTYPKASYLDVPQTAEDVDALAAVLEDERYCGYPPAQTRPRLQREQATRAQILTALDELAARTEAADTVLLFYAGHGQQGTDGHYYLTTHDTEMRGLEVLAGSGIPMAVLLEKIQAIRAERLLFLCNACYAGQLPPNLAPAIPHKSFVTPPLPADAGEALLSAGKGRIAIMACGERQESHTGDGNITIFTQAVIEALKGYGVANNNGFISVFDLWQHVYDTVTSQATAMGEQQEPQLTIIRATGSFPVALYKGTSEPGTFQPETTSPASPVVRSVTEEQSRRRLAVYIKSLANTKNINANGPGAVAADTIYGPVYGGGNTYVQNASGSGIAQAAGPGARASVNYAGSSGSTDTANSRARAVDQLSTLLAVLKRSADSGGLARPAYVNAKAQIEAAVKEIRQPGTDSEAILAYLHEVQRVIGSDASSAAMIADTITTVQRF